ncbi:cobalt-precorrin 5A hydrolase [Blautia stercoris]|uniref:Cobalt-precorrin 5A hydrolase n=1 Tax=Blautia stercoris TaxID=871664 RepID=A0ABR7P702_9FIRM|nr:cobalt-precorrin 5A hydrolase [Blautia stercoris]MBC8627172.1 cobalt-precorrin 5A hydrolase [Blautia stercoris]
MKISIISFSRSGYRIGEMLSWFLGEGGHEVEAFTKSKYTKKILDESQVEADDKAFRNVKEFAKPIDSSLRDWTGRRFAESDAIIFIGACGIAVRSIAPFVSSKKTDPAVVVIDEQGKFAISLLSGHIGGANELTEEISNLLHATPVITTATDINNKFAVDVFAKTNGCYISDMTMAKEISAALVNGNSVGFASDFPWVGEIPKELQLLDEEDDTKEKPEMGIYVTNSYLKHPFVHTLYLVPKIITLGVGCKKDTPAETVEKVVRKACDELLIPSVSMELVASIDLKKEEQGILEYCKERNLPFETYSAEQLKEVEGSFAESKFVEETTGVDNVCERSAILGSSKHGEKSNLILRKYAEDGVTAALARRKWSVQF